MTKAVFAQPPQRYQQQQQQQCRQEAHPQRSQLLQLAAGLTSTLLWCFASSTLIVINNSLYQGGFPFPMMVTGLGQVGAFAPGCLLCGFVLAVTH